MDTSALIAAVKEAVSCIMIGVVAASILYGITTLQTYIYFRANFNASCTEKFLVGLLFFLDTGAMAAITGGAYNFFVNEIGDQLILKNTPPALALETGANALIATLTQCWLSYRLWFVSGKAVWLVSIIVSISIMALGPAMWTAVFFLDANSLFVLALTKTRVIFSLANGLAALCDIMICWSLCYYLHNSRSGFKRSNTIIDRLMLYTIECGSLTAVCQTCILITFVAFPGRIIFIPFHLVVGKLYCNTLLAMLNVRQSIRAVGYGTSEISSHILGRLGELGAHTQTGDCETGGTFGSVPSSPVSPTSPIIEVSARGPECSQTITLPIVPYVPPNRNSVP